VEAQGPSLIDDDLAADRLVWAGRAGAEAPIKIRLFRQMLAAEVFWAQVVKRQASSGKEVR
jgi:hypothetical protein